MLTRTQSWLRQHQVTSFWHNFGISNPLHVPKEMTHEIYTNKNGRHTNEPKKGGTIYVAISEEYMRKQLQEYIDWLRRYKSSWNTDTYEDSNTVEEEKAEDARVHPARLPIYEMIELLQDHQI